MSFAIEVLIEAPIEVVFDYVKDDEKVKEWNAFLIENHYPLERVKENPRVGDTFISVQKLGKKVYESEVEFLEYEPPYIITLGGETKQGYSTTTYVLEEEEEGTLLTLILEYAPSNLFYRILYKLTGWMSRAVYAEQLEHLAECLESTYNNKKSI
ncbi:SRPBCC domain-containing protein [Bacillus cereus]|uniref:SRPBCC domain-containing protein n=1 Tax=Bacillus cereus TaxID=1396 RepID=UPI003980F378